MVKYEYFTASNGELTNLLELLLVLVYCTIFKRNLKEQFDKVLSLLKCKLCKYKSGERAERGFLTVYDFDSGRIV